VRIEEDVRFGERQLVADLSSPVSDDRSLEAARHVAEAGDAEALVGRLYPRFLKHKTVTHWFEHLEGAGMDLRAVGISESQFASTYPLNRVIPAPAPVERGLVSLASIRAGLAKHQGLIERMVPSVAGVAGRENLVVGKGQAYRARYPTYNRYSSDVDVFVPDDEAALRVLDGLCDDLGFVMHGCKVGASAVLKCFRNLEGHELNVGLHSRGFPSAFLGLPMRIGLADPSRADLVRIGGAMVLAGSPEDLLLTSTLRLLRDRHLTIRSLNDVRWLLVAEHGQLDWDELVRTARVNELQGTLHQAVRAAEAAVGHDLAPSSHMRELGPTRLERRLFLAQVERTPGQGADASWRSLDRRRRRAERLSTSRWAVRYAKARLGPIRGTAHSLLDRVQLKLFRREMRLWRRGGTGAAGLLHAFRRRFGSVCELRQDPPAELGFCLGSMARPSMPEEDGLLWALARRLPDRGEERALRKRTTTGDVTAQPHRCEAFLVNRTGVRMAAPRDGRRSAP
jgi:hypothetical protein